MDHSVGGDDEVEELISPYSYCVNTSTKESKKLKIENQAVTVDTFYNDKLVVYTVQNDTVKYYTAELDGSNPQRLEGERFNKHFTKSDGNYFYHINEVKNTENKNVTSITAYDQENKKVDSFKLAEKGKDKLFSPQDESFFIYVNKDENGENQLVLADKSQIGNINGGVIEYKTLCKLNWYEVTNSPYIVSSGEEVKLDNERFIDNQ